MCPPARRAPARRGTGPGRRRSGPPGPAAGRPRLRRPRPRARPGGRGPARTGPPPAPPWCRPPRRPGPALGGAPAAPAARRAGRRGGRGSASGRASPLWRAPPPGRGTARRCGRARPRPRTRGRTRRRRRPARCRTRRRWSRPAAARWSAPRTRRRRPRWPPGGRAGAVVAGELGGGRAGEVLPEAQEEADVGAPEAVDGLVRVADRAEVAVGRGEQPQQPVLQFVDVLVLVHRDPAPAAAVPRRQLVVAAEQGDRQRDQVVEVDQVALAERLVVVVEEVVHLLGGGRGRRAGIARRPDPLAPGDLCRQAPLTSRSTPSRSTSSATRTPGPSPSAARCSATIARPRLWKVATVMPSARSPRSAPRRCRSSSAARRVKVIARHRPGGTPRSATRCAILCVSARVLPVPGPATISSGPSTAAAAR